MELKKLIEELSNGLFEAMCEGDPNDDSFTAQVNTPSGCVEAFYYKARTCWEMEINIYHNHDKLREDENLQAFLAERIEVEWDVVEETWRDNAADEWESHGFRDAADFWHWKEGR